MVVSFVLELLPLLLPVMIFFCTAGGKKRDQASCSQFRSSPMPRSKDIPAAPPEKQQSSKPTKQSENKEKSVESKREQEKEKEKEKKEEKEKEAKTQGSEFKFNTLMLKEDDSQSIHTDLGSLKDDDNPLLDKNVQERLNRTKSEVNGNNLKLGSLKIKASKAKLDPPPKSQMIMPTQSEATVKLPVIVPEAPKQEHSKPSKIGKPSPATAEPIIIENGLKKRSSLVKGKTVKNRPKLSVMAPSHFVPAAATEPMEKEEFCMDNKSKEPLELPKKENKVEQPLIKEKNGSQQFPAPL